MLVSQLGGCKYAIVMIFNYKTRYDHSHKKIPSVTSSPRTHSFHMFSNENRGHESRFFVRNFDTRSPSAVVRPAAAARSL